MGISKNLTDEAILATLGGQLARCRLDLQLTQAQLAEQAGVSKRTLERLEAGASTQLSSFIRILRALDLVSGLDRLVPEPGPRPMDLLRLKGKERRRASSVRKTGQSQADWSWGEDE